MLYKISKYFIGALFIFSGFAKGINPFGLSVQFSDYFSAFGLDFLHPVAPLCAVLLPTVETLLGVMLILGLYRKITAWVVALFMVFFTGLTLWIALFNPVKDCGCFGDILIISNWATFYKNLAFMVPTIIVFMGRGGKSRNSWRTVVVAAMACGLLPLYSYNNLPLIDATPYKIGTNIWEAMNDGTEGEYNTVLVYRNIENGEEQEFSLDDREWTDESKWEYVETRNEVMVEGSDATIGALPMIDNSGVDRVQDVVRSGGSVWIIVAVNPAGQQLQIAEVISRAGSEGVERVVLLHSTLQNIAVDGAEVYTSDHSTLKTLIQHHSGGVLKLNGGVIVDKETL